MKEVPYGGEPDVEMRLEALRCLEKDEYESPEKDLRHIELLRTTGQLDAARVMCARFDSRGNDDLEYFLSRIKEMPGCREDGTGLIGR